MKFLLKKIFVWSENETKMVRFDDQDESKLSILIEKYVETESENSTASLTFINS